MVPFLPATHSPKSPVFYASGKRAKPCAEGSRQGAAEAGIAASAAIQEPLESADGALATECEGFACADFDDMYPRKPFFDTISNQSQINCFFASMRVLSHKFTARRVHSRSCVHARRFVFRASAVRHSDLRVSCVAVRARVRGAVCRLTAVPANSPPENPRLIQSADQPRCSGGSGTSRCKYGLEKRMDAARIELVRKDAHGCEKH